MSKRGRIKEAQRANDERVIYGEPGRSDHSYGEALDFTTDYRSRTGRLSTNDPSTQRMPNLRLRSAAIITPAVSHHNVVSGNTIPATSPSVSTIIPGTTMAPDTLVEEIWRQLEPMIEAEVERRCKEVTGALQDQVNELWAYIREEDDEE